MKSYSIVSDPVFQSVFSNLKEAGEELKQNRVTSQNEAPQSSSQAGQSVPVVF